jgi:hypothetical protein
VQLSPDLPIVVHEAESGRDERQDKKDRQQVVGGFRTTQLQHIVNKDRTSDHERLSGLQTVDASKDVDRVCAKHSQEEHVQMIHNTCGRGDEECIQKKKKKKGSRVRERGE